jgi:DNA-binding transcriptional MerR regulator
MPLKPYHTEKLYYTIGEVAEMFDVNTSLIRYYEKEFEVIKPHKNKKGNRLFTKADLDIFTTIFELIREKGHTLSEVREIVVAGVTIAPNPQHELRNRLNNMKLLLSNLKNQLVKEGERPR